jgi:hypothetical protein
VAELDIAEFLRARLDERHLTLLDVGPARVAWATFRHADGSMRYTSVASSNGDVWVCDGHTVESDSVQVVFDRSQELADVAAKRQILAMHKPIKNHGRFSEERQDPEDCEDCSEPHGIVCTTCRDYAGDHLDAPCTTLRLLALPYAGHPQFREEWKP